LDDGGADTSTDSDMPNDKSLQRLCHDRVKRGFAAPRQWWNAPAGALPPYESFRKKMLDAGAAMRYVGW
jgi:hypothetical protein